MQQIPADSVRQRATLIHREILQIAVLMIVAVGAFFLTRAVAANNRAATFQDAEAWYGRARTQLAAGRVDKAIESLRKAALRDRYDRRYALALAQALDAANDTEAARATLLTLRETAPEGTRINLELARLAARRNDVAETLRFYRYALYAPWPSESDEARRLVRLEMIEFLLDHNRADTAVSELLALSTDLPDSPAAHTRVAQLFVRAGDAAHALEQFQHTLKAAPDDGAALAGAGHSAFQLGDFPLARTYLRRAPADAPDVKETREVVERVLSSDPLAARIGAAERRRRLLTDVEYARDRLAGCIAGRAESGATDEETELVHELDVWRGTLSKAAALDQDAIEAGVDLLERVERRVTEACGPPSAMDRALTLKARQHAADTR